MGGRHGGGGGRLGRLFAHGDLHLLVLFMIAEKPRHGYEVIKSIEARVNGAYSPSPGTIYPALTLLEEQGYIKVEASEGSRKLFAITDEGTAYLAANRAQVEQMLLRMDEVRVRRGDAPPPLVRAMENLKLALRLRLERGPLSAADAQAIAEALDQAARAVERS
ncbi:PadR family transcriptional regulator [Xanthobacter agilis]|jgi:DNA-binding PadR family transcriptional regulator|uniref:DNA-binding PadR family transcriptional regulator n=1 Tax=Xanthobacter agilis TaxID=47492 RepID=A0ABU0LJX4_XANAG|nr:PadR family transcriptional regulator [Xanthobacter agilis]MDQ0507389.1 DNA-binding PadR family transcriptional regulator [Xanthobacter agilis]